MIDLGTLHWMKEHLKDWKTVQNWSPWKVMGKVAGYKWVIDGMTFTTIHGVGHMAAQWAPQAVTYMLNSFMEYGDF